MSPPTLVVLAVPDCPNAPLLIERLREISTDRTEFEPIQRIVHDQAEAERYGMHGSPTLLVNGVDPFAQPGTPASLSCRLYPHPCGRVDGAPSVAELAAVLRPHESGAESCPTTPISDPAISTPPGAPPSPTTGSAPTSPPPS
ncbi:DsbA family protein [Nocardia arthritidis]|uniref:Alkylmercury lyase n=1 Tax=Nocardia arthritidis TaxID=228602 RepID=A0A6G9Y6Y2_9NOCA|nr:DsbA family protein [Nocardia arthritidis]QIS08894.1 alkylmercury lyase [Nocardia arthritidis]